LSTFPNSVLLLDSAFLLEQVSFRTHGDIIGRLRVEAWRGERGINLQFFNRDSWVEELDEMALHWIISENGVAVAAARLSLHDELTHVPYAYLLSPECQKVFDEKKIASISRLVVAPDYRKHAFSSVLDQVRIEGGLTAGVDVMTGATQLDFRQTALSKLGFNTLCELRNAPERPEWPLYFMVYDASRTISPPFALRSVL
jgi:hypothetical protein